MYTQIQTYQVNGIPAFKSETEYHAEQRQFLEFYLSDDYAKHPHYYIGDTRMNKEFLQRVSRGEYFCDACGFEDRMMAAFILKKRIVSKFSRMCQYEHRTTVLDHWGDVADVLKDTIEFNNLNDEYEKYILQEACQCSVDGLTCENIYNIMYARLLQKFKNYREIYFSSRIYCTVEEWRSDGSYQEYFDYISTIHLLENSDDILAYEYHKYFHSLKYNGTLKTLATIIYALDKYGDNPKLVEYYGEKSF